jgi:ESS family glutamate:Na+ symporter
MQSITLSDLETFAAGLAALAVGNLLCRKLKILERLDIPSPVIGGVLAAVCVALLRSHAGIEVLFASKLSDFLLLMFFTTVGLSAKLSALKAGGKPLAILCGVTILMIVAQNITGVLVAAAYGAHPYYGLLVGSISLVGGPGTAAAWATEAQARGLAGAAEVAVAGATLAVISGALVAGPITGWVVKRNRLTAGSGHSDFPWTNPTSGQSAQRAMPVERVMQTTLLIVVSVLIGDALNGWARSAGLVLPGFLTSMLGGVLITNAADLFGTELDFGPIERNGQIALQSFLVMYLMSLKLWTIGTIIVPLVVNIALQIVVTALIAVMVLFRMLGRDYDAALTVGGFIGFGLSSMAVGMATMDKVANRFGPSPKAFLLITLAGSFFVDLANAVIVQLFLAIPIFQ